jgi:hypothetical protein
LPACGVVWELSCVGARGKAKAPGLSAEGF